MLDTGNVEKKEYIEYVAETDAAQVTTAESDFGEPHLQASPN